MRWSCCCLCVLEEKPRFCRCFLSTLTTYIFKCKFRVNQVIYLGISCAISTNSLGYWKKNWSIQKTCLAISSKTSLEEYFRYFSIYSAHFICAIPRNENPTLIIRWRINTSYHRMMMIFRQSSPSKTMTANKKVPGRHKY